MSPEEHARRGPRLLEIARARLTEELVGTPPAEASEAVEPWLLEPGATFVTLRQSGELRGCVGALEAVRPLIDDVRHNAVAAALRDPRFPPLEPGELATVTVEVTLLSPPEPMIFDSQADLLAQLRPGVDGVVLQRGRQRATYLPQVWEMLPDPEAFMRSLEKKAGLATDFWHPEVEIRRYTAEHWSE